MIRFLKAVCYMKNTCSKVFMYLQAREARDILLNLIDKVLNDKERSDVKDSNDILTTIMSDVSYNNLPLSEVKNLGLELLFAGHGTTSSATCSLVYALSKHRSVVTKLRNELEELGLLDRSEELEIDFHQINQLKYLNYAVKEVLRLSPPVGGGFKKALKTFEINVSCFFIQMGILTSFYLFLLYYRKGGY